MQPYVYHCCFPLSRFFPGNLIIPIRKISDENLGEDGRIYENCYCNSSDFCNAASRVFAYSTFFTVIIIFPRLRWSDVAIQKSHSTRIRPFWNKKLSKKSFRSLPGIQGASRVIKDTPERLNLKEPDLLKYWCFSGNDRLFFNVYLNLLFSVLYIKHPEPTQRCKTCCTYL